MLPRDALEVSIWKEEAIHLQRTHFKAVAAVISK
jgi:hypothetical protein